ncbi:MAG: parallel beta-helix repeat-containing protein [Paenibacillus sp.]|nr:parallel beta-helix repeat-containing protein [Paenibacillus sp.]
MQPTETNNKEREAGKPMTRRQLLASMGAAGVLLAAGAGLPGEARAASTAPVVDTNIYYNVKNYGAQGGGRLSQDDTPYIQSAINSASASGGGTVYLPPGIYVIRSSLNMRSKVHLLGAGADATVLRAGEPDLQIIRSGAGTTNYSVEGLTFEGMGVGTASLIPMVECGIYAVEGDSLRVSRCVFKRMSNGVNLIRSSRVSITDCFFSFIVGTDGPYEGFGVIVEGGSNHIIQANHFNNIFKNAILLNAGSQYTLIANNVMEACKDAAILLTSKLTSCSHHVIQGNLISAANLSDQEFSCTYGIRLKDYCSYNTVSNNVIIRPASAGIQLDAAENAGDDRPYANTITGNTVKSTVRGISLLNSDANSVKSNEVRLVETGVLLDTIGEGSSSSAKKNMVTGNSLYQCSAAAVKIGSARCQGNTVFGNAGFDNAAGLADSGTDTATVGF